MAEMARATQFTGQTVALFLADQAMDIAHEHGMGGRHPGRALGGQMMLERLEEKHEIPDRKDVVLHEELQIRPCLYG
jgi:hypothetical protein